MLLESGRTSCQINTCDTHHCGDLLKLSSFILKNQNYFNRDYFVQTPSSAIISALKCTDHSESTKSTKG